MQNWSTKKLYRSSFRISLNIQFPQVLIFSPCVYSLFPFYQVLFSSEKTIQRKKNLEITLNEYHTSNCCQNYCSSEKPRYEVQFADVCNIYSTRFDLRWCVTGSTRSTVHIPQIHTALGNVNIGLWFLVFLLYLTVCIDLMWYKYV